MKKLPRIEKIPEAYSVIADNRIDIDEDKNMAHIFSSDKSKVYTVTWDGDVYTSNDNASYWQNTIGYPVIAVLLKQERLHVDSGIIALFGGIAWKNVNRRHHNQYDEALADVLHELALKGIRLEEIEENLQKVYAELRVLPVKLHKSELRPPV
ncbi:MAG: hypothetical protein ACRCSQ_03020 [Bacteroidales bacterium]